MTRFMVLLAPLGKVSGVRALRACCGGKQGTLLATDSESNCAQTLFNPDKTTESHREKQGFGGSIGGSAN
jgi:hypothetical protein